MRHQVGQRKLGMKTPHRKATLANLATSLVMHERIETTLPRAKELRKIADKIVTLSKKGTVHAMRRARIILRSKPAVQKAFHDFAERFVDRQGGYTRILKLGHRHGDAAPMAVIEYIGAPHKKAEADEPQKGKKSKKKSSLREKLFKKETEKQKKNVAKAKAEETPAAATEEKALKKPAKKKAKKTK